MMVVTIDHYRAFHCRQEDCSVTSVGHPPFLECILEVGAAGLLTDCYFYRTSKTETLPSAVYPGIVGTVNNIHLFCASSMPCDRNNKHPTLVSPNPGR